MMKVIDKNNLIGVSEEDINEYSCGICCEIFVNPVSTQCCRQTYCFECINQWLKEHNTCPNDRQPLDRNGLSQPSNALINLFNNLKTKCNYHLNGCKDFIKINELANHLFICDFRPIQMCKTCEIVTKMGEIHDCLQNLKIKVDFLYETNYDLMTQISKYSKEKEKSDKELIELKTEIKNISDKNKKLRENSLLFKKNKNVLIKVNKNLIEKNERLKYEIIEINEQNIKLKQELNKKVNIFLSFINFNIISF